MRREAPYEHRDNRRDEPYHPRHNHNYEDRDYSHGGQGHPPRGYYRGRGNGPPPFRGRGRGFPSRFVGDREFREPHHSHSHGPPPGPPPPHPGPSFQHHEFHRGRGRGSFRGRGRGFHHPGQPNPYQNDHYDKYSRYNNNNEPVVHRDFTYLEELDRAYEKYFKSITTKNDRSDDDRRSRSPDH